MGENNQVFKDIDGNMFETDNEPIAEGGQGKIFKSVDGEIVIKTIHDKELPYEKYMQQLNETSGIFIHPNAGIARPIIGLAEPEKGYVMRFLDGGEAIGTLMKFKSDITTEILKEYNELGGLKRRLLLLKDLAKTLWYVHRTGAVYGDISDKNVFISKIPSVLALSTENTKICLIDADNIRIGHLDSALYTPGYGAPEVVLGNPNNAESDMYSFALLAYILLNINNPFDGVAALEENWDDDPIVDNALETAEVGGKAFIYDMDDHSNRAGANMVPWQFGLTKKMLGLFERSFSNKSRKTYKSRPSASEWIIAFSEAVEELYYCNKCKAHHYHSSPLHEEGYIGLFAIVDNLSPLDDGYKINSSRKIVFAGRLTIIDEKARFATLDDVSVGTLSIDTKGFVSIEASSGYTFEIFEEKLIQNVRKTESNIVSTKGTILVTNNHNPNPNEYSMRITFLEER